MGGRGIKKVAYIQAAAAQLTATVIPAAAEKEDVRPGVSLLQCSADPGLFPLFISVGKSPH